tara:strand:+ start:121 stop:621 length:501 start_codon:yes stop_codon:yes gene_type:complete
MKRHKECNNHEINWDNAIFVTWEIEAGNFADVDKLGVYIDVLQNRDDPQTISDYREVWQRDNNCYVVVSWFNHRDGAAIWNDFTRAEKYYAEEGVNIKRLKQGVGNVFFKEKCCFNDCVKVLETVDGNLVAVRQLRKALSGIQGINGYALCDSDMIDKNQVYLAAE